MPLPELPQLIWQDGDFPSDGQSGDVFYAREGGLAETLAVFLAGCGLPQGWQERSRFAIGELGFGSGLNALACWRMWRQTRQAGAVLHYVSIESRPWSREDAARAHGAFPEIADLSAQLLARWPHRAFGPQRRWFDEDGFCLTLLIGPCEDVLAGMTGPFDAWLLDGFAPAKNPGMWSIAAMQHLARLSAPGARAATYSVASPVREALRAAGFEASKHPGFGRKRQRLEAQLTAPPQPIHSLFPRRAKPIHSAGTVLVVGAGIAGASVTRALTRRGVAVTMLEAAPSPAHGASGNPLALLTPRLDRSDDAGARFYRAAYLAALDAYAGQPWFRAIGALQRPRNSEDALTLQQLLAAPPLPAPMLQAHADGLWHPMAGVLDPTALIHAWTAPARLQCAAQMARLEQKDAFWQAYDAENRYLAQAEVVVLCAGPSLAALPQTAWLPMVWSGGQIEYSAHSGGVELGHAVTGAGYAAPWNQALIVGATFERQNTPHLAPPNAAARRANLDAFTALTGKAGELDMRSLISRTGIRASAPDYLPIAGLMPDAPAWLAQQAGLAHGRPPEMSRAAPALTGLYVLGGLSARGFLAAPILGELIAGDICGEPALLDESVLDALHPGRFLLRALKRGEQLATLLGCVG